MGRVIAVANQKGGVGKTTTAINLSACLAEKGQKVLAIDMDPQGNMTSGLGIDKDEVEKNIYDLMIGQVGVEEVLQKEVWMIKNLLSETPLHQSKTIMIILLLIVHHR